MHLCAWHLEIISGGLSYTFVVEPNCDTINEVAVCYQSTVVCGHVTGQALLMADLIHASNQASFHVRPGLPERGSRGVI